MTWFETTWAALTLLACAVLLLRLSLGSRRRARLDAWLARMMSACRQHGSRLWHWRRLRRRSAQEAAEAIRRARATDGTWEGNVYKPKSFHKPPDDTLH